MATSTEELQKHIKTYWKVGFALFGCTILTVLLGVVEILDFGAPGVDGIDIVFGLGVATFKCSLVMLIFMHLNHERGFIYKTLLFTLAFAVGLMALTLFAQADPIPTHSDVVDDVRAPSSRYGEAGDRDAD